MLAMPVYLVPYAPKISEVETKRGCDDNWWERGAETALDRFKAVLTLGRLLRVPRLMVLSSYLDNSQFFLSVILSVLHPCSEVWIQLMIQKTLITFTEAEYWFVFDSDLCIEINHTPGFGSVWQIQQSITWLQRTSSLYEYYINKHGECTQSAEGSPPGVWLKQRMGKHPS